MADLRRQQGEFLRHQPQVRGVRRQEVFPFQEPIGGLAETADEAIRYVIRTERDGDRKVACALAGPTCDSLDVLYEKEPYFLPISLEVGDKVLIEGTGAYTTTYSSVGFNGFAPLKSYVI